MKPFSLIKVLAFIIPDKSFLNLLLELPPVRKSGPNWPTYSLDSLPWIFYRKYKNSGILTKFSFISAQVWQLYLQRESSVRKGRIWEVKNFRFIQNNGPILTPNTVKFTVKLSRWRKQYFGPYIGPKFSIRFS